MSANLNDFQPTDIHPVGPDCWRHLAERREVLKQQAANDECDVPAADLYDEADETGPVWFQVMERHPGTIAVIATAIGALPYFWA